jgi:hypothetical protein
LQIGQRLKFGLNQKELILRYNDNSVKIYEPRGGRFVSSNNLFKNVDDKSKKHYLISRVAQFAINASSEDIAKAWLNQGENRSEWDSNCSKSKLIKINDDGSKLSYYKGYGGLLLTPAREFYLNIYKMHGAVVGIDSYTTSVLVSINNDDKKLPSSFLTVRGYQNSVLILEKQSADRTLCTLITETGPGGWLYPISGILSMIITSRLASTITSFIKLFDKNDIYDNMSVEEVARNKFEKAQKEKNKEKLLDDADKTIYKEDLQSTIRMLENKLTSIQKTERSENIDLSDLKRRVVSDIKSAKSKLSNFK